MHGILMTIIDYVIAFIEICGIAVIIITVFKEMYNIFIRYKLDFEDTEKDTTMNHGLASALEILLGAEILKTIAYRDVRQLVEVAALILIRVFMTVLIHWEMNHKIKHKEEAVMDHKLEYEKQRKIVCEPDYSEEEEKAPEDEL